MTTFKKITLFIALQLLLVGIVTAQTAIDQIVGVVGKEIILKSDVEGQYFQLLSQGSTASSELKCKVLEELLIQKLMLEQATIDSVVVPPEQVDGEIDRRIRYFVNQLGSEQRLEEYYKKSIVEIKNDFRDVIGNQLLVQRMQQNITGDVTVTPAEVKEFYSNFNKDSLPLIPEEVKINQIVITPKVSEVEKLATKKQLLEYKQRIEKGEEFQTLALLYSEDPGSAVKGGELGDFGRGMMVPAFEQVAFALKPEELSDIVETDFGYHLLQGIERKGDQVNVRHILLKTKVSTDALQKSSLKTDSIYNLLEADSLTFEEAVAKYSDDIATKKSGGTMVNPQTGTTSFGLSQLDAQLSLAVNNLNVGEYSKPFVHNTKDGQQILKIVQLKKRIKAHKANLEDDYNKIQEVTLANKKQQELESWVKKVMKESHIEVKTEVFDCQLSDFWQVQTSN